MSDTHPIFDRDTVLEGLGGDLELYGEIARLFLAHYTEELNALREALADGNAQALHHAAHSLKGAVSNFAAPQAVEAARATEFAHKMDDELAGNAATLVAATIDAVEALATAMRADLEASGLS